MDSGFICLRRVLQRKATQLKQSTSELMKQELGGQPSFNFEQITIQYWGLIACNILKLNGDDNIGNIPKIATQVGIYIENSYSSSETSSSDDDRPLIQPISLLAAPKSMMTTKPRLSIRKLRKLNKKANKDPQQWKTEYHSTLNNQRVRNATVYATNKDETIWNVGDGTGYQQFFKFQVSDENHANLNLKNNRELNKRGLQIQQQKYKCIKKRGQQKNLSKVQTKKVSTFGKHQNVLNFAKWAFHVKADYNNVDSPIIKRSSSNEEDVQIIIENKKEIVRIPNQELGIRSRNKMTSYKFLDIPVDKDKAEKVKLTTSSTPVLKKRQLNNGQIKVYQLSFHSKCKTERSPLNLKSFVDITPQNKDQVYSTQKKIAGHMKKITMRQSSKSILPSLKKRDSLFKSLRLMTEQKSSNQISTQLGLQQNKKKLYVYMNMESPLITPTILNMHRKHITSYLSKN